METEITDLQLLAELTRQGIKKEDVILHRDYCAKYPSTKIYRVKGSKKRIVVISSTPVVTEDGERISAKWKSIGAFFFADNNLFTAVIEQGKDGVEVNCKDRSARWQPMTYLNNVRKTGNSGWQIINDESTLETDYGFCRRQLILRNGGLLEYYIFDNDPKGDVRIKSNYEGDIKPRKYWARDGRGKSLKGFETNGDEKIISAQVFANAVYPIVIDDSVTFYSSADDGYIFHGSGNYNECRTSGWGDTIDGDDEIVVGQEYDGEEYYIYRGVLFFDTSSLEGKTIEAATLSIYTEWVGPTGNWDIVIQNPDVHQPLQTDDYDLNNFSGDGGSIHRSDMSNGSYADITLNADGRSWINKTGTTKLALCSSDDINGYAPGSDDEDCIEVSASEHSGTDQYPKLIITYPAIVRPLINGSLVNTGLVNGVLVR